MSLIVVTDQQTEAEWNRFTELMREISREVSQEELQPLLDDITAISMEYSHSPRKMSA